MSAFKSGEYVKNLVEIEGTVVEYRPQDHPTDPTVNPGKSGQTPDTQINQQVRIREGQVGTVMYSDDITTIVTYDLHNTGPLEPHLVKAESFTSNFKRVVRGSRPSRGPSYFPDRRPPRTNPTNPNVEGINE
jgi:hypothetical protein